MSGGNSSRWFNSYGRKVFPIPLPPRRALLTPLHPVDQGCHRIFLRQAPSGITIDFTADGLTIQGGKNIPETPGPPCQDGLGGGICAQVSSLGSLGVALSRVTLTRNLANSSGGGLAAVAYPNEMGSSLNLTATDSVVTGNAAGFG